MKILMTGATGFIGKALLELLIEKGYGDIKCVVRGTSDTSFLEAMGITRLVSDISDGGGIDRVFRDYQPDVVFHCAAGVMNKNEAELYRVNAIGTRNICQACYKYNTGRLIYLSSIAVVCGNDELPLTDALPYKAKNAYGRSKVEAERIAADFREKGLKTAIIRPCMVYGKGEPHALDGILRLVSARRFPVFDVPAMDSKLQLVSVKNVVGALYLALIKDEALSGTFIVADDDILTIRRFLELLYESSGSGEPPVIPAWAARVLMLMPFLGRAIKGLLKDRLYDTTRAKKILGYSPVIATEKGLKDTVEAWKTERAPGPSGRGLPDLPV